MSAQAVGAPQEFAMPVAAGGYAWWYLDALAEDSRSALVAIAFIGSVFSPYYAAALRRAGGGADPYRHCALNLALYLNGCRHWALTERAAGPCTDARVLALGTSRLAWDDGALTIDVDERAAPWPRRLVGRIAIAPQPLAARTYALDAEGRHSWTPLAVHARVRAEFQQPRLRFDGHGYLDCNRGAEPLEAAFAGWDWSRARAADGSTLLLYDVIGREGTRRNIALRFDADGSARTIEPPPVRPLPATRIWRVARTTRADRGADVQLLRTLEDTPFYARSLLTTRLHGAPATAVHESLALTRFRRRWVQALLPFRMRRIRS